VVEWDELPLRLDFPCPILNPINKHTGQSPWPPFGVPRSGPRSKTGRTTTRRVGFAVFFPYEPPGSILNETTLLSFPPPSRRRRVMSTQDRAPSKKL